MIPTHLDTTPATQMEQLRERVQNLLAAYSPEEDDVMLPEVSGAGARLNVTYRTSPNSTLVFDFDFEASKFDACLTFYPDTPDEMMARFTGKEIKVDNFLKATDKDITTALFFAFHKVKNKLSQYLGNEIRKHINED